MDSDVRKRLATATKKLHSNLQPAQTPLPESSRSNRPSKLRHLKTLKKSRKTMLLISISSAAIIVIAVLFIVIQGRQDRIVPKAVQQSVSFPVYYPDPKKMPAGYTLDQTSFRASNGIVTYAVASGTGKNVVFTVQQKPPAEEIENFYQKQLPLGDEVRTAVGTGMMGSLNEQTFASLPTSTEAWLIITAPKDINKQHFEQILQALKR